MKIHIIRDIEDAFLKQEWERLEKESDVFPQNNYDWCTTWWKYLSGKRKLYVVMVLNEEGKALGIAPLCIERNFGVPVLCSFPIGFGDFYSFIISPYYPESSIINKIVEYLLLFIEWKWVKLINISESNNLSFSLMKHSFRYKILTSCVVVNLSGLNWDAYLKKLNKKFRGNVRNRFKKITKDYSPKLRIVVSWEEFKNKYTQMVHIYQKRWHADFLSQKSDKELVCRMEAFKLQFINNKMRYFELILDGKTVAYRLGFLVNGTFYSWHTSFDPDYKTYHIGQILMAMMIMKFIDIDVRRVNFMAGDYKWKRDWSPDQYTEKNYIFTSKSNTVYSFILNFYYHRMRDILISLYRNTMNVALLRSISKLIIKYRKIYIGRG
jgi:CelD/BcsL family acetyltransferase involved in cellulose biosynthesis